MWKENAYLMIPTRNGRIAACIAIYGDPGSGKSVIAKHVVTFLSHKHGPEKIIIFDCFGEWNRTIRRSFGLDGVGVHRLKHLGCPQFFISDFPHAYHWEGMGFLLSAASIIERLIREGYHHFYDDPKKFEKFLGDIPTSERRDSLEFWNAKYDIPFEEGIHRETKKHLVKVYQQVKTMFVHPEQMENRIDDWKKVLSNPYKKVFIIDFPLEMQNIQKTRSYVARIIEIIRGFLNSLQGIFFIFEEAQYLVGRESDTERVDGMYNASRDQCTLLVKKDQKRGNVTLFISQHPGDLAKEINDHVTHMILGRSNPKVLEQYLPKKTYSPFANAYNEKRRMILVDRNTNSVIPFYPCKPLCKA